MEISLTLSDINVITLTPKSEDWKKYMELIKNEEKYVVIRENNSNNIMLKLIK